MASRVWALARCSVSLPFTILGVYLLVLYSNGFWYQMIGSQYLWISVSILVLGVMAWYFGYNGFQSHEVSGREKSKHLFTILMYMNFLVTVVLVYLTRPTKTQQCVYLINSFLRANRNTFYADSFRRRYSGDSSISVFVHYRTQSVHDISLCVLLITTLWHLILVKNYHRTMSKLGAEQGDLAPLVSNKESSIFQTFAHESKHDISHHSVYEEQQSEHDPKPVRTETPKKENNDESKTVSGIMVEDSPIAVTKSHMTPAKKDSDGFEEAKTNSKHDSTIWDDEDEPEKKKSGIWADSTDDEKQAQPTKKKPASSIWADDSVVTTKKKSEEWADSIDDELAKVSDILTDSGPVSPIVSGKKSNPWGARQKPKARISPKKPADNDDDDLFGPSINDPSNINDDSIARLLME